MYRGEKKPSIRSRGAQLSTIIPLCFFFLVGAVVASPGRESSPSSGAGCQRAIEVMGTLAEAEVLAESEDRACRIVERVFRVFREVDELFSTYKPKSPVSRFNQQSPSIPTPVPSRFLQLVLEAERFYMVSDGAFDITIWPLIQLWGFQEGGGERKPPSMKHVRQTLKRVGMQHVAIDHEDQSLAVARNGMGFDFGGIAKGYALDLAAEVLSEEGVERALIDLGRNYFCLGSQEGSGKWILGIQHPSELSAMIDAIAVADQFVSSSGNYEQYLIWDGRQFGHILDPKTGWPATKSLAVTVIAEQGTASDALSTAAFVLGPKRGIQLLDSMPGAEGIIYYEKRGVIRSVETGGFSTYRIIQGSDP